jgi:hypothetical protein
MRFITKVLTALVGFAFTFAAFGKAEAQEAKVSKNGTVVLAREHYRPTKSMTSLEELRNSVTVLASDDAKAPTKGTKPTKNKTKSPTKPTKHKGI